MGLQENRADGTKRRILTALLAGTGAGIVMSMAMMTYMASSGRTFWTLPNLIAATWLSDQVAGNSLGLPTLLGFATHMSVSILMGFVAIPFIDGLGRTQTFLSAVAYSIASYPVVFGVFLTWMNPLMVQRAELVPMTLGHALFGLVLGGLYWKRSNAHTEARTKKQLHYYQQQPQRVNQTTAARKELRT